MKTNFPIVGSFSTNTDKLIDTQDTVNMYVIEPSDGLPAALAPTPGLRPMKTLPLGREGRGEFTFQNYKYSVISQFVYRLDAALNYTQIGTLATNQGPVGISVNQAGQIIFVDGSKGWIWDTVAGTWSQITADGFPTAPTCVAFLDTCFYVNIGGTSTFAQSGFNDGFTWDSTKRASLQTEADIIVGISANKGQMFIIGNQCTEIWRDSGGAFFSLSRDNNMRFAYGCAAVGSIAQGLDMLVWLANNDNGVPTVRATMGGEPVKISTPELENAIASYGSDNLTDATGFVFSISGHTFYQLNFTAADASWLFDFDTKKWFRLEAENGGRHWAESHVYFNGVQYVCAYNSATIYQLDPNYNFNGDERIKRERITAPFVDPAYRKIRINSFELILVQGVGANDGIDKQPFVEFSWSKDGGYSYSKAIRSNIGKQGKRQARTVFYNLGIGQRYVFRIRCYNGVKFVVGNAAINYDIVGQG